MNKLYLGSAYWAPVSYYTAMYRHGGAVIEQHDVYMKQTYRNRCTIIGAQGEQVLTVPIEKPAPRMLMRDIRISDHGNWRHLHRSAIASAIRWRWQRLSRSLKTEAVITTCARFV